MSNPDHLPAHSQLIPNQSWKKSHSNTSNISYYLQSNPPNSFSSTIHHPFQCHVTSPHMTSNPGLVYFQSSLTHLPPKSLSTPPNQVSFNPDWSHSTKILLTFIMLSSNFQSRTIQIPIIFTWNDIFTLSQLLPNSHPTLTQLPTPNWAPSNPNQFHPNSH